MRVAVSALAVGLLVAACVRPTVPSGSGSVLTLEGTRWRAVSILGQPPVPHAVPTLDFDNHAESGGTAGCNGYGTTEVTASDGAIDFGELVMTAMLCSDDAVMRQESRFFGAMNDAELAELREGHLVIAGPAGELVFEQVPGQD